MKHKYRLNKKELKERYKNAYIDTLPPSYLEWLEEQYIFLDDLFVKINNERISLILGKHYNKKESL